MKRWHGYALVAAVMGGLGGFVVLIIVQLSLTPQMLAPFCAASLLISLMVVWELLMKPWGMRREAWDNLRNRRAGSAPRARKLRRPVQPPEDPAGPAAGVPAQLGQDDQRGDL